MLAHALSARSQAVCLVDDNSFEDVRAPERTVEATHISRIECFNRCDDDVSPWMAFLLNVSIVKAIVMRCTIVQERRQFRVTFNCCVPFKHHLFRTTERQPACTNNRNQPRPTTILRWAYAVPILVSAVPHQLPCLLALSHHALAYPSPIGRSLEASRSLIVAQTG